MLFEEKDFVVDVLNIDDLLEVTNIYNSNKNFLKYHMDKESITYDWLLENINEMKFANFSPCKIIDKSSNKILGIIYFKISKETYLSLLMFHKDYTYKGLGTIVFRSFEKYLKSNDKCSCISVDVITSYPDNTLNFWIKNGFTPFKNIELDWNEGPLSATLLKKDLK